MTPVQQSWANNRNKRPAALCLVVVSILFARPIGAQQQSRDQFERLATTQEFLRSLYPELRNKTYVMNVSASTPFDSNWTFMSDLDVSIGPSDPRSGNGYWRKAEVLGGLFQFRREDGLNAVKIRYASLQLKLDAIRVQVNSHQQWSDRQVVAALKNAGARFGPNDKDALQKVLPLDALEPFIGKLNVDSTVFFLRHKQAPRSLAELYWEVDGTSSMSNGEKASWSLVIEPFEGKLQSLIRAPQ